MSQASFRSILSGLAVVIGLVLTPSLATAEGIKIAVVTHGQSADSYWGVVKKGVDDAAKLMGVDVSYQAPPTTRHGRNVAHDRCRGHTEGQRSGGIDSRCDRA